MNGVLEHNATPSAALRLNHLCQLYRERESQRNMRPHPTGHSGVGITLIKLA
jgi:hypothetical protein